MLNKNIWSKEFCPLMDERLPNQPPPTHTLFRSKYFNAQKVLNLYLYKIYQIAKGKRF